MYDTKAQPDNWGLGSKKGLVFEISNKEAQRLLTKQKSDDIFKSLLHTIADTFDVSTGWKKRPMKGHFLLVKVHKNKMLFEYTSVFPYQVFLLKEFGALALQVLDLEGNIREDASVKLGPRKIVFDTLTKTYRMENKWFVGSKRFVTVDFADFRSVFNIAKHDVPYWDNNDYYYNSNDGPDYYSYMITDKNRYKPNEKIRFKSFALSGSKTPLRKELEVWILENGNAKRIGRVGPHRPGSYVGEVHLHDSLRLTLDWRYSLQLRARNGRVVASCNFKYEDYELFGNQLEIELKNEKQYHPFDNEVSIKATDVNGLMLKDAAATLIVTSRAIRETFDPVVILPDTLLNKKILLDPNMPTVVPISTSLFGKSNTAYNVNVVVTNSENERIERSLDAVHYFSEHEIVTRFSNDSIIYEMQSSGVPQSNIPARIIHTDLDSATVVLPFKEKINPVVTNIKIKTQVASREFSMRHLMPKLEVAGGIEEDTFNVSLINPQKLEVSWFVYQGNELLSKGSGKMEHKSAINDRSRTYYVELLYSFGGQENIITREYQFRDDILNVSLDIPDRVYPGQSVEALIRVENQGGLPVANVDLTAFAVTSKLGYFPQTLPYYGSTSDARSDVADFSKEDVNKRMAAVNLDYNKWKNQFRLDTMRYYQFTYPFETPFKYAYAIQDSTQFAPFVMKNGLAQEIYVIELNRNPIYYSWVTMPPAYSFYVSPKTKSQVTLRLFDRVLILDSIAFEAGKKTILSIDLDHLPKGIEVVKLYPPAKKGRNRTPPAFTPTEIARHTSFIAGFKQVTTRGYLESRNGFIPLFYGRNMSFVTAGPVAGGRQTFSGEDYPSISYQHEGGFNYAFEDNIVYKTDTKSLVPTRLFRNTFDPSAKMAELVLTKKQFLEAPPVASNKWHARSIEFVDPSMRLTLLLPEEKEKSGIARVILLDCKTGKLISPCRNDLKGVGVHTLPRGCHHVVVLYNNGRYLKAGNIELSSFTKAVIDFNQLEVHSADRASQEWLLNIADNCYQPEAQPARAFQMRERRAINGNVQGTVLGMEDNLPLPGVNVIIKGTIDGTVTDMNGQFSLTISEAPAVLVFSFIGLQTEEVEVQAGSIITVAMTQDVKQLQEVVVVAYGLSSERRSLTASISIRGASSLSGRAAGVQIDNLDEDDEEMTAKQKEQEVEQAEKRLYEELMNLNSIRSNFSDVGFWEPTLFTDKEGKSKFRVTFPDNITRWDATVYAMNRKLQTGTARKSIKSFKPLMAEFHVPRFLTLGDSVFLLGKILNYTQDSIIRGKTKWTLAEKEQDDTISFAGFHSKKIFTHVISTDTIKGSFIFTGDDGYMDGEQREVPVVDRGIIRAEGSLGILQGNDIVDITGGANEKTIVEILDNPIDVYANDAKNLIHYRYDCNEQLASKLMGFLSFKLAMQFQGKPFRYEKDVNRIINRLLKNQNQEFLWSWWDVSPNTSDWMSAHILRALKTAQGAGYTVDLDLDNLTRKAAHRYEVKKDVTLWDVELLNALATWGVELNYAVLVKKIDSLIYRSQVVTESKTGKQTWRPALLAEKLLLMEVKQLKNIPYERDSLLHYKKEGILGDVSFSGGSSTKWYHDDLTVSTVAYRIVKRDSSLKMLTVPMQLFFLKERQKNSWNTYHAANVLMSVLPDLMQAGTASGQIATVKLSGKANEVLTKFPYRIELSPGETLRLEKQRGLPLYFMQYNWERVTSAKTGVEGFTIRTALENKKTTLQAGQPVNLLVEVNVKRDASMEHVMIEVPLPGACSYGEKRQYSREETHREYFKEKAVIFCEKLKAGTHTFSISMLPRFTGKFYQNPAQVSLMYVPVVNANTEIKVVRVE